MKKFLFLTFGVIIAVFCFTGCKNMNKSSTIDEAQTKEFTQGVIEDGVYKSKWLGLKYTPDEDMTVANENVLKTSMNLLKGMYKKSYISDLYVDFLATRVILGNDDNVVESVEVVIFKLEDSNLSEDEFIKLELTEAMSEQTTITKYELCKAEFKNISNLKNIKTNNILLKKIGNYILEIWLTASDEAKVNKLLSGFSVL